jgi:hypothetical protein
VPRTARRTGRGRARRCNSAASRASVAGRRHRVVCAPTGGRGGDEQRDHIELALQLAGRRLRGQQLREAGPAVWQQHDSFGGQSAVRKAGVV